MEVGVHPHSNILVLQWSSVCRCTVGGVEGRTELFFFAHYWGRWWISWFAPSWVYTSEEMDTNTESLSRTVWGMTVNTTRHICLRTVQDVSPPLCPSLFGPFKGVGSGKQMKVSRRRGEDCSRGVLYCSSCSSGSGSSSSALWWQAGAPLSRCCSLQCRRPPRLCLCGHIDRLRYWGCRDRQGLSFGKLVALLSCNGFIYSHRTFMLRLANPTSIAPDVLCRLKGRVLLLLRCTDSISLFLLQRCV